MRGYFGIGIYNHQKEENIGTLWRSAYSFGAAFIFTIGRKYHPQCSDTCLTPRHIPLIQYTDFEQFYDLMPVNCRLVGVEITEKAQDIKNYSHLHRCVYLLGSESGGLPEKVLQKCHNLVKLPGRTCLNVSTAGSLVMFDRINKL